MSTSLVPAPQPASTPELEALRSRVERSLTRLDALAKLMDDQFELPIIHQRFGLDPLIGLIPGGGDWVAWFVGLYIFWEAMRLGVPRSVLLRMAANIGVDLLGGYAPGLGDAFDLLFKSNRRNVTLVREHFGARPDPGAPLPVVLPERALLSQRESRIIRIALGVVLTLLLAALASGPILLLLWFFNR